MRNLNICVAGLGNVGSNLISTIIKNNLFVENKSSLSINIKGISAKNFNKKRTFDVNLFEWCQNPLDLLKIKDCDVLIELIGEEKGVSFDLVKRALESKINVVTANKALLAKNGSELFRIADKNNVLLLYEAAVAGGIPIIKTIKNNIFLNKIKKISGILNGTTNYILTTMNNEKLSFKEVLNLAKSKGYTNDSEASLDIDGLDSAHKLTILATICFGSEINFDNNDVVGISNIKVQDIINANQLGYKIKLISEASIIDNKIFCSTSPKLIEKNKSLANVDGVLNAINIETDQLKSLFLEGEGAGGVATASSVISDLYEITSESNLPSLGYKTVDLHNFKKFDNLDLESSYYIRIMTKDISGVLSKITGYFKDFNISIKKIIQLPESNAGEIPIPIIIFTHEVRKDKLMKSINEINKQDFILQEISVISIYKN